jgi:hypothetical protein
MEIQMSRVASPGRGSINAMVACIVIEFSCE